MTRSWSKLFVLLSSFSIFFFTNPAPTEIYTLSLHDALPILAAALAQMRAAGITGTIYTHPIGDRGHGAGPLIGLWDHQEGVPGRADAPRVPTPGSPPDLKATPPFPNGANRRWRPPRETEAGVGAAGGLPWT